MSLCAWTANVALITVRPRSFGKPKNASPAFARRYQSHGGSPARKAPLSIKPQQRLSTPWTLPVVDRLPMRVHHQRPALPGIAGYVVDSMSCNDSSSSTQLTVFCNFPVQILSKRYPGPSMCNLPSVPFIQSTFPPFVSFYDLLSRLVSRPSWAGLVNMYPILAGRHFLPYVVASPKRQHSRYRGQHFSR